MNPRSRRPLRVALALWVAAMLVLGSFTVATHVAALPVPDPLDGRLRVAVSALRVPGHPLAVHALYADCRCSQRILQHLARRGPAPGVTEAVLLVGSAPGLRAAVRARGFRVVDTDEEGLLRRWRIESAPTLVVADATGVVRYAGGYRRGESAAPRDAEVIAAVARGARPPRMPVLGCPVSARLRARLDPLGLRAATPPEEGN